MENLKKLGKLKRNLENFKKIWKILKKFGKLKINLENQKKSENWEKKNKKWKMENGIDSEAK